jgi:CheY-like chemotaxis protein
MQPIAPKIVRLAEFVGRTLPLLRDAAPASVRIEWQPEPAVVTALVRADEQHLRQVLLHLLSNARDAIGERSGTVRLTLRRQRLPEGLAVTKLDDSYLALGVDDDGEGMDPARLQQVFEPFYSGNEGPGLGLSLVRAIVTGHEGFIDASSEPGKGSQFTVYLPEVDATTATVDADSSRPLVLVAEDEPGVRKIVGRILEHAGYRVVAAANGNEAVELLEQHKDEVTIMMLDAIMPGLGGEDVYRRVQELRPDLPVLLSSGYSRSSWPPDLLERDRVAVLTKPYDPANLLVVLEGLLPPEAERPVRRS